MFRLSLCSADIHTFAADLYRKGDTDDYFGLEEYRRIVYYSKPDPNEEEFDPEPYNKISHLTAHQLAFAELKASLATRACHCCATCLITLCLLTVFGLVLLHRPVHVM